jgi:nitrile hydratase
VPGCNECDALDGLVQVRPVPAELGRRMNGIHDVGGMDNFGPLRRQAAEPVFHAQWERAVFAHALAMLAAGYCKADEMRRLGEWQPPADYLRTTYYEKWLFALESMLIEKAVVTREELDSGRSLRDDGFKLPPLTPEIARQALSSRMPGDLEVGLPARFTAGDRVLARNIHPIHHTRLPRYARGKRGIVERDHGVFPLPDISAHGGRETPQRCYSVRFTARELWGADGDRNAAVYIDLFDDYMEPLENG